MTLAWPAMLALALLPVTLLAARWLRSRRTGDSQAAVGPNILRGRLSGGRVRLDPARTERPWRLWLAVACVIVALARPQAGEERGAGTPAPGDILIALDLSRSMLARDVRPSRLEQARMLARALVETLPEQRIGLAGFAGSAHLLAPASTDRALFDALLDTVRPAHMPVQGSNLAALCDAALAALPARGARLVILLSDGEADASPWRERAPALKAAGIGLIAVGLGTAEGAPLFDGAAPVRDRAGGQVHSRMQARTLDMFAALAGGRTLPPGDPERLAATVRQMLAATRASEAGAGEGADEVRPVELFPWLLALGLLMLAWSALAEWPGSPRLRPRGRAAPALATSALALVLVGAPLLAQQRFVPPDLALLENEGDPLEQVKELVAGMVARPRIEAGDYQALAEAALRYGEVHRGHAHPLQEGVLRDGIAAVRAGQRLDPRRTDWTALGAKLERYLEPPPAVRPDGEGEADPANEPVDARREAPVADGARALDEEAGPEERQAQAAGDPDMQKVGGGENRPYDPAEWRNPSLVRPLHVLEQLRADDAPAEMFRLMQAGGTQPRPVGGQTW